MILEHSPFAILRRVLFIFPALVLALWVFFYAQYPINPDISVLSSFGREWLAGGIIGIDFYDSNPPFNMLLYAPAVMASMATGVPIYYTSFVYCLLLLLVSTLFVWRILRHIPLPANDRIVIVGVYVLANTILAGRDFGERDHVVLLGLFPFALLQFVYFSGRKVPGMLQWPILMAGSFTILLKPHFGLVPTLLMGARLIRQKKILLFFREPDFIALSLGVIIYAALTWFFFPNFITMILGDMLALYAPVRFEPVWPLALGLLTVMALFWLLPQDQAIEKAKRNLVDLFTFCAILSILCFVIQNKGFYYHLLPAVIFTACLAGYSIYIFLSDCKQIHRGPGPVLCGAALVFYAMNPFPASRITHGDIKNLPVAKILEKYCSSPCNYLMIGHNGITNLNLSYLDANNVSRLPSPWFLSGIHEKRSSVTGGISPEGKKILEKYRKFYAEDIAKYKPDVIILLPFFRNGDSEIDVTEALFGDPDFEKTWPDYALAETVEIVPSVYFDLLPSDEKEAWKYNIYRRKIPL